MFADTLIRTSQLLRNSKTINTPRAVSFADSNLRKSLTISERVDDEFDGGGETDSSAFSESLDMEIDDQTTPQQTISTANLPSTERPNKSSPPSKPSEGSLTTLDQLTGHIAFMRLLEAGECLSSIYRCARICGLDVHEGLLLFGKDHFYVIDGFTLMNTHEIVSIEALPPGMKHKPIVPTGSDTATGVVVAPSQKHPSSTHASDLVSSGAIDQISGNQ